MVWPQSRKGGKSGNSQNQQSWQKRNDSCDSGRSRPDHRDRDRVHDRDRDRSTSSELNSKHEKKLEKAKKLLLKKDTTYKSFVESSEKKTEDDKLKAQGAIMATALEPALKAALGPGFVPPAKTGAPSPSGVAPTSQPATGNQGPLGVRARNRQAVHSQQSSHC